jgi:NAD+ synthase
MSPLPAEAGTRSSSSADVLWLDAAAEIERIAAAIREQVFRTLRRKGAVLGLSGGVDSSVAAALCVRALGKDRVLGLPMRDADSSPDSLEFGRLIAGRLGIRTELEDITPVLEAAGCYRRRDAAIRTVISEYKAGYKSKIVLCGVLDNNGYMLFSVVVQSPEGHERRARLTADAFLAIVAATNFKQRVRKMMEYHYADRSSVRPTGSSTTRGSSSRTATARPT